MTDHDERVSRRYAELAREEPGGAIDAAILASSKRSLARDSWTKRWAAPVSIAAVLVLALGVTLRMQQEQPGIERTDAPRPATAPPAQEKAAAPSAQDQAATPAKRQSLAPAARKAAPQQPPQLKQKLEGFTEPKPFADAAAPRAREEAAAPPPEKKDAAANVAPPPAPAAAPSVPAAPPAQASAGALAAKPAEAEAQKRASTFGATAGLRMQAVPRSEEEIELERIARLRVEGKHEEADKALAEFRRKHPDYRIPEATWERVKPR